MRILFVYDGKIAILNINGIQLIKICDNLKLNSMQAIKVPNAFSMNKRKDLMSDRKHRSPYPLKNHKAISLLGVAIEKRNLPRKLDEIRYH